MSIEIHAKSDLPKNHQLTGELYTIPDLSHDPKFTAEEVWNYWINVRPFSTIFLGGYRYVLSNEIARSAVLIIDCAT